MPPQRSRATTALRAFDSRSGGPTPVPDRRFGTKAPPGIACRARSPASVLLSLPPTPRPPPGPPYTCRLRCAFLTTPRGSVLLAPVFLVGISDRAFRNVRSAGVRGSSPAWPRPNSRSPINPLRRSLPLERRSADAASYSTHTGQWVAVAGHVARHRAVVEGEGLCGEPVGDAAGSVAGGVVGNAAVVQRRATPEASEQNAAASVESVGGGVPADTAVFQRERAAETRDATTAVWALTAAVGVVVLDGAVG
jgi:hypothetical protein